MDGHNVKPKIIVITGPTATGKTMLGIRLAEKINGEIVSADSMQVYKHMDIGTAKPAPDEMRGIPHHMIDIKNPWEDYSVALYVKDATLCINDIISRGRQPVIVGGSGLYIDSLIRGRVFIPAGGTGVRKALEDRYDRLGGRAMLAELMAHDRGSAARLHENDKKRIVRALEVLETTGVPLSVHDAEEKKLPPQYDALKFALTFSDRSVLYNRIRSRVDAMVSAGLFDEVSSLLKRGVPLNCTAMQAIGYKEIAAAITAGTNLQDAAGKVKMESTRYAKRQLTWLRRDTSLTRIIWNETPDIGYGIKTIEGQI